MKSLKEINSLSLEELERVASERVKDSPESFEKECEALIDRVENASKLLVYINKRRRPVYVSAGVAAVLVLALGIGIMMKKNTALPKDTFDDPVLAYIEVSKTLEMLAGNMNKGVRGVSISQELLEMPSGIINEKNKNK